MKRFCFSVITALAFVFVCVGCNKKEASLPMEPSKHFEAVSKHLDFGGLMFGYVDIDGDLDKATTVLQQAIKGLPKDIDIPPDLDVKALVKKLGLSNVDALGLSSVKNGDIFENKLFIHHTGERSGLMKMFGGPSRPFTVLDMAPEDADIVFEQEIDLKVAFDLTMEFIKGIVPKEMAEVSAELSKPVDGLPSITYMQLIEKLHTTAFTVIRVDDKKRIKIPGEDFEVPYVQAIIALESMGTLFDAMADEAKKESELKVASDDKYATIEISIPLPEELSIYSPVLAKDKKTNRVYLASSREFLDECVSQGTSIKNSKSFKHATAGLSLKGNGISYVSPHFSSTLNDMIHRSIAKVPELKNYEDVLKDFLPQTKMGTASISMNMEDGIYFASNSDTSYKSTMLIGPYTNPMIIGIGAAVAIPAFVAYMKRAKSSEASLNIGDCYHGAVRYFDENNSLPPSSDWTPSASPTAQKYSLVSSIWETSPWQELGFYMTGDHFYRYRFINDGDSFKCQAQGNLDGDQVYSLFTRRAQIVNGEIVPSYLVEKENELE